MSTAYELQIYQNGQWQFDSYFEDRDTVVSEAERMNSSGRYAGVRVLEETYREKRNACEYHVIYSRLGKDTSEGADWRGQYRGASAPSDADSGRPAARRPPPKPQKPQKPLARSAGKRISLVALFLVACFVVLMGIAAIIGLRVMAGID